VKILIISSNLIGDTILSTGVIDYFYKKNPNAKFTFLIGPTASQIYSNFPALEKIIEIKKKKFNLHWLDMYLKNYRIKWDIVIDFRSSLLSYILKSKKRYIFKKNINLHHLEQLKESFNLKTNYLNIYNSQYEENFVNNHLDPKYKYVVIFPGGNWLPKIWSVRNYNVLIKKLFKNFINIKIILVGSYDERKIYYNKITENISENIFIDLMGKNLSLTSAYMKKSHIFIGNDSGLTHLSVASNLTTICLFGPTNDKHYGHRSKKCFVIRTKENYDFFTKLIIDKNKSYMHSIKPDQILEIINKNKLL